MRVGIASAVLVLLAACSNDPVLPIEPGATKIAVADFHYRESLTTGERMRALRARTRAATGGVQSVESIIRTYDGNGDVVHELVRVGAKWTSRPSTLPANLAARTLRSFVSTSSAMMSTQVPFTATVVDTTVQSVTYFSVDTLWSDTSSNSQLWTHELDTSGSQLADITYSSSSNIGKAEHSTYMYALAETVDGDEWVEHTLSGSALAAAQADFVADTSGFGSSLKMASSQVDYVVSGVVSSPLRVPISLPESTDVAISSPSGMIMFSAILEKANCNSYRIAMRTANASANFLGVLVVGTAWCPPCQVPALVAYGTAKAAYVGAAYGLKACLELDPYG